MKYLFFILFVLLIINTYAQQGWFWQNPLPQGNPLLSVSFFDSETGVVVGKNGTFLKTSDGGNSWEYRKISTDYGLYKIVTPAADLYYAIGDSGLLIKSSNGGMDWDKSIIHNKINLNDIWFFNETTGVLVADSGFVFITSDGGDSWESGLSPTNHNIKQVYFLNDSIGWLLTEFGNYNAESELFITQDGGVNWQGVYYTSNGFTAFIFADESNGFVTNRIGQLLKTTNGGLNWTVIPFSAIFHVRQFQIIDNTTIVGISFGDFNDNWIIKTTNSGQSWIANSHDLNNPGMYFINSGKGVFVDSKANIYSTTNLGSSFEIILGGNHRYINDLEFIDENFGIALFGFDSYLRTTNGGTNWKFESFNSFILPTKMFFLNEELGWVCGYEQVLRTDDGGNSWISYNVSSADLWDIQFLDDSIGFCIDTYNLYKSTNSGVSWTLLKQFSNNLSSLYFLSSDVGFTGMGNGNINSTTDGGLNWIEYSIGDIGAIKEILFVDSLIGYGLNVNGFVKTINRGIEWQYEVLDSQYNLNSLHFVDRDYGWIVGADGILLKTINGGISWTKYITGTSNFLSTVDFVNRNIGWISGGNGTIMKNIEGGVSDLKETENNFNQTTLNEYLVSQNYPNPFNPTTKIKYKVPGHTRIDNNLITLKVYDILGNEIATLINEEKPAGIYEVEWNANGLPSGIYLYQLITGNFIQTKKMILLK